MDPRAIGVFDSGVGGLTVARELHRQLPEENVLYLGDTARVPYGPRGPETIARFALELTRFLVERDVKALVVACNSVSATAINEIRAFSPVPVIDVIGPTVRAAVAATRTGVIGVVGTVATVTSSVYHRLADQLLPGVEVIGQACPLFVPIAEEGLTGHAVARLMAEEYLQGLRQTRMDVLILGCTHYPLLKETLAEVLGPGVTLIDSAEPTVGELAHLLDRDDLRRSGATRHEYCVTDASYKFMEIATRIIGPQVSDCVRQVSLEPLDTATLPSFAAVR